MENETPGCQVSLSASIVTRTWVTFHLAYPAALKIWSTSINLETTVPVIFGVCMSLIPDFGSQQTREMFDDGMGIKNEQNLIQALSVSKFMSSNSGNLPVLYLGMLVTSFPICNIKVTTPVFKLDLLFNCDYLKEARCAAMSSFYRGTQRSSVAVPKMRRHSALIALMKWELPKIAPTFLFGSFCYSTLIFCPCLWVTGRLKLK